MTIERNPVPGAKLPPPLACVDFVSGQECAERRKIGLPVENGFFTCPNRGYGEGKCQVGAFVYPRKKKSEEFFHFHQGIDIAAKKGTPIVSVTSGYVVHANEEYHPHFGGYGRVAIIETAGRFYFYAHCDEIKVLQGQWVEEGTEIATVGCTAFNKDNPTHEFSEKNAHLHFEVTSEHYPLSGAKDETKIDADGPRLDPLKALEALGPWGMAEVYLPSGETLAQEVSSRVEQAHRLVEHSNRGGYFPLGANNTWHGGVHLPVSGMVVAPFDGEIVAVRLDPSAERVHGAHGSTNFILLRHELSESAYAHFQGKVAPRPAPASQPEKKRAVGDARRSTNHSKDVLVVKRLLHSIRPDGAAAPYYAPSPEMLASDEVEAALVDSIKSFQGAHFSFKPDGVVEVGAQKTTWRKLHELTGEDPVANVPTLEDDKPSDDAPARDGDGSRILYSLVMHLDALEVADALKKHKKLTWPTRVPRAPSIAQKDDDKADDRDDDAARRDEVDERAERTYRLKGHIGPGDEFLNDEADVQWVQKRLRRFKPLNTADETARYYRGDVTGRFDDTLRLAIAEFQNDHHKDHKATRNGPGKILKGGSTERDLRKPPHQVNDPRAPKTDAPVDSAFIEALTEDDGGTTRVVAPVGVRVKSGEPLWPAGLPGAFTTGKVSQGIHWEIFSEHKLVNDEQVAGWDSLPPDNDDDLTLDAPALLLAARKHGSLSDLIDYPIVSPRAIHGFYQSEDAIPLRRTQAFFRSEWDMNLQTATDRILQRLPHLDAAALKEQFAPFQWWGKVPPELLPPRSHVWHCNPIEFVGLYAEYLEALKTTGPGTGVGNGLLSARFLYANEMPFVRRKVTLTGPDQTTQTATTDERGRVLFTNLEPGLYLVGAVDSAIAPLSVLVNAGERTDAVIQTLLPTPRGALTVIVRKSNGGRMKGARVTLTPSDIAPQVTPKAGEVVFEVQQGVYDISVEDRSPDGTDFVQTKTITGVEVRKKTTKSAQLPPAKGVVEVDVQRGGAPGHAMISVSNKKAGHVATAAAEIGRPARIELEAGFHTFESQGVSKHLNVGPHRVQSITLSLPANLELGQVEVLVRLPSGDPLPNVTVLLSGNPRRHTTTNESGLAIFTEVEPGRYTVEVEGDRPPADLDVVAGMTSPLVLETTLATQPDR